MTLSQAIAEINGGPVVPVESALDALQAWLTGDPARYVRRMGIRGGVAYVKLRVDDDEDRFFSCESEQGLSDAIRHAIGQALAEGFR